MAHFGDTQSTLEDNPFADPFSKRSSTLDPWANPYSQSFTDEFNSQAAFGGQSTFVSHPEPQSPTQLSPPQSPASQDVGHEQLHAGVDLHSDPLDSAAVNAEVDAQEKPEPPTSSLDSAKSPGFKDVSFSQTETIRPSEPEDFEHSAPLPQSPPAVSPPISPVKAKHKTSESTASSAWGPLDQPTPVSERPFPNLVVGGEVNDWNTDSSGMPADAGSWGPEPKTVSRFPTEVEDDDSDDDRPIGEILRRTSSHGSMRSHGRDRTGLPPQFIISVDDPQKIGDPIRGFTMYTVHTRTSSPLFTKSAFSVLRRYSDFLWLYETLSSNNPGVVVPPVPEKHAFGRFDETFVKQRRLALEKCIQKIANHPVLCKDPDLKLFLESDTFALDIKHRKAEIANERGGGIIATIGNAVVGPKFYETDEWFEKKRFYIDSLESQLKGLAKTIEFVAKHRAELAQATGEFTSSVEELASSDVGAELSQSLAGLAHVEGRARDLHVVQSDQDMVTLLATVDEYARLINSVRLAFSSRIRIYHAWRNADAELVRVKQNHERNRAQGKIPPERLSWSLSQIADAERKALDSKLEFESVSKLAKQEVARFEKERIEDFKNTLHAFLEGMIARQKELIGTWEKYQQTLLKRARSG